MRTQKSTFFLSLPSTVNAGSEPENWGVEATLSDPKEVVVSARVRIINLRKNFFATFSYYEFPGWLGKGLLRSFFKPGFLPIVIILTLTLLSCRPEITRADQTGKNSPLRILLDRQPVTLNPRMALDTNGQRLGELIYSALTRKNNNLQIQPDLAESWKIERHGRLWRFVIRRDLKDQAGAPITSESIAACVNEYFYGKPKSVILGAFSSVESVEAKGTEVFIHLKRPDPYLATNLTAVRYFRTSSSLTPCHEPKQGDQIIASGNYKPTQFNYDDLVPEHSLSLGSQDRSRRDLLFTWALDDGTKALRLLRGDVDVLQDSISLAKTRWIASRYSDRFEMLERSGGVNVSYLAFNLKHPDLGKLAVRRAISLAINRREFVQEKLLGFGAVAGSFLSPLLPESAQQPIEYNPELAEKILDQAGYPRAKDGVRLRLHFKTTPVRDGFETTQVLREMLGKIGVELTLEVVEPAVFFASIRKKAFELYTSRWVGVSDGSIFYRTLFSRSLDNRASYSSAEMDALLEASESDISPEKHSEILAQIQKKMVDDLPYLPLWYWNTAAVFRKELKGLHAEDLSLCGSLEPLTHLR